MKVVCSSRGSRGDVHPILEIATELDRRGHRVVICVPKAFAALATSRGLDCRVYPEDIGEDMRTMDSGLKAWRNALAWVSRAMDEQFSYMLDETVDADAMVTSVNEFAAPSVAEHRRLPHFRIAYTPVLPGYHPPPLVPWQGLPRLANRALWGAVNFSAGLFMRGVINEKRSRLGLGGIGSTAGYFIRNSHTVLAINQILAPPCRTWFDNYNYSYSGYCHGMEAGDLDPLLERFLEDGPPPLYFGFGSVSVSDPAGFTAMVIEAARRARCRIVLGAGWTGLGARDIPETVLVTGDTNHARLFPRCAAVSHHGGCGTVHAAARAGVPQFIMPQIADQFYWGHRIYRLGLGPRPVRPEALTVKKLTDIMVRLTVDLGFIGNSASLGERMRIEDGTGTAADIIEGAVMVPQAESEEAKTRSVARG